MMYRYSKCMVTLPDLPIFGRSVHPKFSWSLTCQTPAEFLTCQTLLILRVPKFGMTDLAIFVFTLPDYREIGRLEKNGQWDHGISRLELKAISIKRQLSADRLPI